MTQKNAGFTLVELVLVLVLLGILGAVAVPKYFDLQDEAQQKAARLAVAEAQSRIEARFSELILNGEACSTAVDEVKVLTNLSDSTKNKQAVFGDYGLSSGEIASTGTEVTVKVLGDTDQEVVFSGGQPKLYVPECTSDGGSNVTGNSDAEVIYNYIKANQALKDAVENNGNDGVLSSYMLNESGSNAALVDKIQAFLSDKFDVSGKVWSVEVKSGTFRVAVTDLPLDKAADARASQKYVQVRFFDSNSTDLKTGWVQLSDGKKGTAIVAPSQAKSLKTDVKDKEKYVW